MSLSINTNSAATSSASNLNSTNAMLQKSLQRLSSGSRIVDAADDAGGLAVSMKMGAKIRRTDATNINLANAQSFLKTQDGAFKTADKVLNRMSELAVLAQDVTKTSGDVANYQLEFTTLQAQLSSLALEKFNGVPMFGSNAAALSVATTEDGTATMGLSVANMLGDTNMIDAMASTNTITDGTAALATMGKVSSAISSLATMRAQNGSEASRLAFSSEMLTINKANLELANSRIADVDVAAESTQMARFNILQQAGTAMLAQANQSSQAVLKLLQ